jgi:hypothetical protein
MVQVTTSRLGLWHPCSDGLQSWSASRVPDGICATSTAGNSWRFFFQYIFPPIVAVVGVLLTAVLQKYGPFSQGVNNGEQQQPPPSM